jgi:hypothetical protein
MTEFIDIHGNTYSEKDKDFDNQLRPLSFFGI